MAKEIKPNLLAQLYKPVVPHAIEGKTVGRNKVDMRIVIDIEDKTIKAKPPMPDLVIRKATNAELLKLSELPNNPYGKYLDIKEVEAAFDENAAMEQQRIEAEKAAKIEAEKLKRENKGKKKAAKDAADNQTLENKD